MNSIVPVVLALDENYIVPTVVAISSIINNFAENKKIHLFYLVPEEFNEKKANELIKASQHEKVYEFQFVRVTDKRFNEKCTIKHITYPTYYRLIMSRFLPYDKCIYVDGDIVVMNDLSTLYDIDMGDNFIAGVITPYSQIRKKDKKCAMERLGIDSYSKYVNAGVLLFNLKRIREYDLENKFISLLDKDFPVQDQDILNSACYPNILKISPKYNCLLQMYTYSKKELLSIYTEQEIEEVRKNPVIYHFADKYKPWNYYGQKYGKEWETIYCMIYDNKLSRKSYKLYRSIHFIRDTFKAAFRMQRKIK